jgi:hypothetical protein
VRLYLHLGGPYDGQIRAGKDDRSEYLAVVPTSIREIARFISDDDWIRDVPSYQTVTYRLTQMAFLGRLIEFYQTEDVTIDQLMDGLLSSAVRSTMREKR